MMTGARDSKPVSGIKYSGLKVHVREYHLSQNMDVEGFIKKI